MFVLYTGYGTGLELTNPRLSRLVATYGQWRVNILCPLDYIESLPANIAETAVISNVNIVFSSVLFYTLK